ncbi:MAG: hypothetical protein HY049_10505 [Acidobacteria bacterium]|nr:hypothetical protein [Acidobacteriota bacterium]
MSPASAANPGREHVCPLCSARFMSGAVRCGACPMSRVCDLECCPNCGYEFVERSATVEMIQRVGRALRRWASGGPGTPKEDS